MQLAEHRSLSTQLDSPALPRPQNRTRPIRMQCSTAALGAAKGMQKVREQSRFIGPIVTRVLLCLTTVECVMV